MTLALSALPLTATITPVKTMTEVEATITELLATYEPYDILAVFDVDFTITQPDHPAACYPALMKHAKAYNNVLAPLTPAQRDLAKTLVVTSLVPQRLVEASAPAIIKRLQAKGLQMIALTAILTGKFKGFDKKIVFLRRDQLQKKGIDFRTSCGRLATALPFQEFGLHAGDYPTDVFGYIAINGEESGVSKGDMLVTLIKDAHHAQPLIHHPEYGVVADRGNGSIQKVRAALAHPPKVIILIDDRQKYLEAAEAALKTYDPTITFIGLQYEGAYHYAPKDISEADFRAFWQKAADEAKALVV